MRYVLPYGGQPGRVVMLVLNGAFNEAWRTGDGDKADPEALSPLGLAAMRQQLQADPNVAIQLPELAIDMEEGKAQLQVINGRTRLTALRAEGHTEVPVLVSSKVSLAKLYKLPFIKPVPEEMRSHLSGEDDPNSLDAKLRRLEEDPQIKATIKRWALQPENMEWLRKSFADKGFGLISEELIAYYQQHGTMPPRHMLEEMMKKAMERALEQGKTIDFWVLDRFEHLLSPDLQEVARERAEAQLLQMCREIREHRMRGVQTEAEAEPSREAELGPDREAEVPQKEKASDQEPARSRKPNEVTRARTTAAEPPRSRGQIEPSNRREKILRTGPARLQPERHEPVTSLERYTPRRDGPNRGGFSR